MKLWRVADNPSDDTGIFLLIILPREANRLIFEYIVCSVENTLAIDNLLYRLALLPDDKESSERIDSIEFGKVKIASVKHIARQRLVCEPVHRVDIMYVGVGDSVEHRNLRDDLYDFLNLPEGQWLKIIKKRSPEEDKIYLHRWNSSPKRRGLILRIAKQKPIYRQLRKNKSQSPIFIGQQ